MQRKHQLITPILASLFAALALSACDRHDDRTAGQKLDAAVATADHKTQGLQSDAAQAGRDIKSATGEAMKNAGEVLTDASITAKVNAELAKDAKLSAMKIDVDTSNGRVALKGTAPDPASRDRATQIAQAVEGVTAVDNQLIVGKSS